jgi:3-oxoacyl-[acyl-carrier-protein] synthase II
VTGIGVFCASGKDPQELVQSIRDARCGISPITVFNTGGLKVKHAGEIKDYSPPSLLDPREAEEIDHAGQFGIIAAAQALADSGARLEDLRRERVGLVVGVCAGGRGFPIREARDAYIDPAHPLARRSYLATTHFAQTEAVASKFGIHGPCATLSTACASSGSALGYAYDLLQAGKADLILCGGLDAFGLNTYAGFYALGAMATKPCSPFSVGLGVSFGEGAGFVVLEPLERARARGAKIYGELLGFGARGDAHHITAPHPSGEGLARAIRAALAQAGLTPDDIDYVNAHGTGTRDNDTAETQALKQVFKACLRVPPVSSSKSFFGHTLGAAAILEFIVSLLCQNAGLIPPTINFESPRPGCDLDYVPNEPRPAPVRYFLSTSAAFGGINTVVVGGRLEPDRPRPPVLLEDVVITGIGLVSPLGCRIDSFLEALRQGRSGVADVRRFDTAGCRAKKAALVTDFEPRKLVPSVELRRLDLLNQYSAVAAGLALKDAGLARAVLPDDRLGVVQVLTRGLGSMERFLEALSRDGIEKLSARFFPAMVLSTVGGQVSQAFNLKGINSVLVGGPTAGLQGLAHGYEMLRQGSAQDALVVVAADEVGALYYRLFDRLGLLAGPDAPVGEAVTPYDPRPGGMVLGEGAAALVLERGGSAQARGARAYARVAGCGLTAGSDSSDSNGWLLQAMQLALAEAGLGTGEVDVCYGHGRGLPAYDAAEARAWGQLLRGRTAPVCCVLGNTGVAEAACGLFSAAAAALGLARGEAYPLATAGTLPQGLDWVVGGVRPGVYRRALVAGGSDAGNNAAVVLAAEGGQGEAP